MANESTQRSWMTHMLNQTLHGSLHWNPTIDPLHHSTVHRTCIVTLDVNKTNGQSMKALLNQTLHGSLHWHPYTDHHHHITFDAGKQTTSHHSVKAQPKTVDSQSRACTTLLTESPPGPNPTRISTMDPMLPPPPQHWLQHTYRVAINMITFLMVRADI